MAQDVDSLQEQLQAFRRTHTYHHHTIANVAWSYLVSGQRDTETLLLLPGVHGLGEMAFQHITRFEQHYRVISVSYPAAATTVAALVDGIVALLAHEQVEHALVVGGSYSGMIAQSLLRRYPHKVEKLVLDHTSPPNRRRTGVYKRYRALIKLLPLACIRAIFRAGNHLQVGNKPHQLFWRQYFDHTVLATLTKEDYLNRALVCIDYHQNYSFTRDDIYAWYGDLLIVEADDDVYVPASERETLKALYPLAQVYTFHKTGHAAWASEFETFFSVIADFL